MINEIRPVIHNQETSFFYDVQLTDEQFEQCREYATQNDYVFKIVDKTLHLHPVSVWDLALCQCALCGQPLSDSTSVQAGVGPKCRGKYNYGDAIELSAEVIEQLITQAVFGADFIDAVAKNDSRLAANILCRWIALWVNKKRRHDMVLQAMDALKTMGYDLLVERITKRICSKWSIKTDADNYLISSPFDETWRQTLRALRGSNWDGERKCWIVPKCHQKAIWSALKKQQKNTFILGPNGIFLP